MINITKLMVLPSFVTIAPVFKTIRDFFDNDSDIAHHLDRYITKACFKNNRYYQEIKARAKQKYVPNNITETHPEKTKKWGSNGPLRPEMYTAGSDQKVEWICDRDPSHTWRARISSRCASVGLNCKKCANLKPISREQR